ncbi:MAG: ASPIC/UnbV domain-containing protein [Acidobacteriota bacterium]
MTGVQKEGMHWLLRNLLPAPHAARSLNVRVVDEAGLATLAGADVRLLVNGTQLPLGTRLVDAGSGYNSQNDAPLHFGVPAVSQVYLQASIRRPGRGFVATSPAITLSEARPRVRVSAAGEPALNSLH